MAGKKNLSIVNQGDSIVIRNLSAIAASVTGTIALGLCLVGLLVLKDAWELPYFWLAFAVIFLAAVYSFAKIIFAKILLDSPKKQMIVYTPLPKKYNFEDVNYIDLRTENGADGLTLYVVTVYIGVGKRTVKIISFSNEQAEELAILLRGMLDNGAMTYPEWAENPFGYEKPRSHEKAVSYEKPSSYENSFGYKKSEEDEFKCIMRRRDNSEDNTKNNHAANGKGEDKK